MADIYTAEIEYRNNIASLNRSANEAQRILQNSLRRAADISIFPEIEVDFTARPASITRMANDIRLAIERELGNLNIRPNVNVRGVTQQQAQTGVAGGGTLSNAAIVGVASAIGTASGTTPLTKIINEFSNATIKATEDLKNRVLIGEELLKDLNQRIEIERSMNNALNKTGQNVTNSAENLKDLERQSEQLTEEVKKSKQALEREKRARENVTKVLNTQTKQTQTQTQRSSRESANPLNVRGSIVRAGVALGATGVIIGIGRSAAEAAVNVGRLADTLTQLNRGFDTLARERGLDADALFGEINRASRNTLSVQEALSVGARALATDIEPLYRNLGQVLTDVADVATLYGRNVAESQDRVIAAIQKQEQELLDELGIVVRAENSYRAYAASIGKAAKDLTDKEKATAFAVRTIKVLNERAQASGRIFSSLPADYDNVTQSVDRLSASWESLSDTIGTIISPEIQAVTNFLTGASNLVNELFARFSTQIQNRRAADVLPRERTSALARLLNDLEGAESAISAVQQVRQRNILRDFFSQINLEIEGQRQIEELNTLIRDEIKLRTTLERTLNTQIANLQKTDYGRQLFAQISSQIDYLTAGGQSELLRRALVLVAEEASKAAQIEGAILKDKEREKELAEERVQIAQDAYVDENTTFSNWERFIQDLERRTRERLNALRIEGIEGISAGSARTRERLGRIGQAILDSEIIPQSYNLEQALNNVSNTIGDVILDLATGEFRFEQFRSNLIRALLSPYVESATDSLRRTIFDAFGIPNDIADTYSRSQNVVIQIPGDALTQRQRAFQGAVLEGVSP